MPSPVLQYVFKGYTKKPQPRALKRISDGDTPEIEQPVRMVSADTCEKSGYAGKSATSQKKLDVCRERLEEGYFPGLPDGICEYYLRRLTPDAAERHIAAAESATAAFEQLLNRRLARPDGKRRKTAVIPTGQLIDDYGRLLAYIAPYFANTKSDPLPERGSPERRTFNLDMIGSGWAAFFPIYPSLPPAEDLTIACKEAEDAWNNRRGAWERGGSNLLLGYEYRTCIKLGTAKSPEEGAKNAFQRVCIDLRTMENCGKFGYPVIPPCYRLWVWENDVRKATMDLGLK